MADEAELNDHVERRRRMVDRQIERRGIDDPRILGAMRTVPRHLFVAPGFRSEAYEDRPLPIGGGQTISQPFVVARMLQLADIDPSHRVLDVGTGSGYAAAVLAHLAASVVSVEVRSDLAESARGALADYSNVEVVEGTAEALPSGHVFDRILVAAAAREIPAYLVERLADGGRLVLPVGSRYGQHLWTVDRRGEVVERERHEPVAFVPLM